MTFAEAQEIIRERWPKEYVSLTFVFDKHTTSEKAQWQLYIAPESVLTNATWDQVVAYLRGQMHSPDTAIADELTQAEAKPTPSKLIDVWHTANCVQLILNIANTTEPKTEPATKVTWRIYVDRGPVPVKVNGERIWTNRQVEEMLRKLGYHGTASAVANGQITPTEQANDP